MDEDVDEEVEEEVDADEEDLEVEPMKGAGKSPR